MTTESQVQLNEALDALRKVAASEDSIRQQHAALREIGSQPELIKGRMAELHQTHAGALAGWARAGAKAAPPAAPAEMAQLAQKLADAEAQAVAADAAARELDGPTLEAQAATQRAQDSVQQALAKVIRLDFLPGLVQAVQAATIRREALIQQLGGLGYALSAHKGLHQYCVRAHGDAITAASTPAVLAPGAAEASRVQWRELIDALLAGEHPTLPTPPPAILCAVPPSRTQVA